MPAQALSTEFLATLPGRVPVSGAVSYFDTEIKGCQSASNSFQVSASKFFQLLRLI